MTNNMKEKSRTILRAVIELVGRSGFENVTIGQVAERVSVAEGTLYNHFRNKEDMLSSAFSMTCNDIAAAFLCGSAVLPKPDKGVRGAGLRRKWKHLFRYLLVEPDKASYYCKYRYSNHYSDGCEENLSKQFRSIMKRYRLVGEIFPALSERDAAVTCAFIVESTCFCAFRMQICGEKCSDKEIDGMIDLISGGIESRFGGE